MSGSDVWRNSCNLASSKVVTIPLKDKLFVSTVFYFQVLFYDVGKQKIRKEFKLTNDVKLTSIATKYVFFPI